MLLSSYYSQGRTEREWVTGLLKATWGSHGRGKIWTRDLQFWVAAWSLSHYATPCTQFFLFIDTFPPFLYALPCPASPCMFCVFFAMRKTVEIVPIRNLALNNNNFLLLVWWTKNISLTFPTCLPLYSVVVVVRKAQVGVWGVPVEMWKSAVLMFKVYLLDLYPTFSIPQREAHGGFHKQVN